MSPVSGAADLERKNAYWIEFGKREERDRIISLLKIEEKRLYDHGNIEGSYLVTGLIALIQKETND